jgi:hypothetical protein
LQALCIGMEDIKAQDNSPYGFTRLHKHLVKYINFKRLQLG